MSYKLTRSAAREIGVSPSNLIAAIGRGKIPAPEKDETGRYLWTPEDIARARTSLAIDRRLKAHRREEVVA